jgi:hypothetical protein
MLRCDFKGKPGESQILEGRYQIMTTHYRHRLINPILWGDLVSPGSKIAMAVVFDYLSFPGTICLKCGGSFESLNDLRDRIGGMVYKRWYAFMSIQISQSS